MLGHDLEHYVILAGLLFALGAAGFVARRNLLSQLLCLELMMSASVLALIAFNRVHVETATGQVFALLSLTVMAAQMAVGLAVIIGFQRARSSIDVQDATRLRH